MDATCCVYDPQSAFDPESFSANGSHTAHLAVIANAREILQLGGGDNPVRAATRLLEQGAEVVVVKSGAKGALVVTSNSVTPVPPHRSKRVWTIGSGGRVRGNVCGALGVCMETVPWTAAHLASLAVASYAETMALPVPSLETLRQHSALATASGGRVYLAGPFFTVSQRWFVDEVRRGLLDLGLTVFSPVHDVGPGPAQVVGPADIAALEECDVVFAILDGLDSGNVIRGRLRTRPRNASLRFGANGSPEDLKMIEGSQCRVYDDLVTALHHLAWRA